MDINGWRKKIDKINTQMVKLINQRAECAIEIGKIKKKKKLPVIDPQRENHIIEKICALNKGPISNKALIRIFKIIIEENRLIEKIKA